VRTGADAAPSLSEKDARPFRDGMRCFFEEGRVLASLSHPNVVRVLNFFRANDTAYMVMRLERGATLKQRLQQAAAPLPESWLRRTVAQLLNGLREVHACKLLHLDIKPANIHLREDATPVLIDFGASRRMLGAEDPLLRPIFTPGLAAPEVHCDRAKLGPWSDIYSIGATMYACRSAWRGIVSYRRPKRAPASIPLRCWSWWTGACGWIACSARRASSR
jgi:hypothetical protein